MSSIGDKDIDDTIATFDPKIDGLLYAARWSAYAQKVMSFSITTSKENYEDTRDGYVEDYPEDIHEDIVLMPDAMVEGIKQCAAEYEKILAFSFKYDEEDQNTARVRFGLAKWDNAEEIIKNNPAYAHYPDEETGVFDELNWMSGDIFLRDTRFESANPQVGTYVYYILMHEIGHTMGLKHGHLREAFQDGAIREALPPEWDSLEFTVMTYRAFVGAPTDKLRVSPGNYAQSLMMLDIAALQSQYGADHSTEKGDTVYSWNDQTGEYFINGESQWTPAANVVFMTIWDGNGSDAYDLSNYKTNLSVDLNPGGFVDLKTQSAQLGKKGDDAVFSRANVFNALLHENDTRSLIEHAKTGDGDDRITGNIAFNRLDGGAGADTLRGDAGDDTLTGGDGRDDLDGGEGIDYAGYAAAKGVDVTIKRIGPADQGAWSVTDSAGSRDDDLKGIEGFIFGAGRDVIRIEGAPEVDIFAGGGDDRIAGGGGGGVLVAGKGSDTVTVESDDVFNAFGGDVDADGNSLGQKSQNDLLRIDLAPGDGAFFLTVVDPTRLSEFFDGEGSTAEGFARIEFNGTRDADSVDGGVGNDTMVGHGGADKLNAHAGNDRLRGEDGGDQISGGAGDDTILGGEGGDRLQGDEDDDVIEGGAGSDTIFGGEGDDKISTGGGGDVIVEGNDGDDTIEGGADGEVLVGGADRDRIDGAGGKDIITGDAGNDTLAGGAGDDTVTGGGGEDRFTFRKGFGVDNVNDFDAVAGGGQDRLDVRAFGFETFKDFQKDVTIAGSASVTIRFEDGSVLKLLDVAKSTLDAGDFLF